MNIFLLCATKRGYKFFKKIHQLVPTAKITVISFQETEWEPKYIDAISSYALECNSDFYLWENIRNKKPELFWNSKTIDLMFLVCWRYILSPKIYKISKLGTFVFHDSLLPKYRGFSPTVWAIINGENYTGVTLFKINKDIDSGEIIDQKKIDISQIDTISEVIDRVTAGYMEILEKNIESLINNTVKKRKQNHAIATYTCKRLPSDNLINWNASSKNIYNLIRAVTKPYSGAYTFFNEKKMIIWEAKLLDEVKNYVGRISGRVVEIIDGEGVVIQTGDGCILLTSVQLGNSNNVKAFKVINKLSITLGI